MLHPAQLSNTACQSPGHTSPPPTALARGDIHPCPSYIVRIASQQQRNHHRVEIFKPCKRHHCTCQACQHPTSLCGSGLRCHNQGWIKLGECFGFQQDLLASLTSQCETDSSQKGKFKTHHLWKIGNELPIVRDQTFGDLLSLIIQENAEKMCCDCRSVKNTCKRWDSMFKLQTTTKHQIGRPHFLHSSANFCQFQIFPPVKMGQFRASLDIFLPCLEIFLVGLTGREPGPHVTQKQMNER